MSLVTYKPYTLHQFRHFLQDAFGKTNVEFDMSHWRPPPEICEILDGSLGSTNKIRLVNLRTVLAGTLSGTLRHFVVAAPRTALFLHVKGTIRDVTINKVTDTSTSPNIDSRYLAATLATPHVHITRLGHEYDVYATQASFALVAEPGSQFIQCVNNQSFEDRESCGGLVYLVRGGNWYGCTNTGSFVNESVGPCGGLAVIVRGVVNMYECQNTGNFAGVRAAGLIVYADDVEKLKRSTSVTNSAILIQNGFNKGTFSQAQSAGLISTITIERGILQVISCTNEAPFAGEMSAGLVFAMGVNQKLCDYSAHPSTQSYLSTSVCAGLTTSSVKFTCCKNTGRFKGARSAGFVNQFYSHLPAKVTLEKCEQTGTLVQGDKTSSAMIGNVNALDKNVEQKWATILISNSYSYSVLSGNTAFLVAFKDDFKHISAFTFDTCYVDPLYDSQGSLFALLLPAVLSSVTFPNCALLQPGSAPSSDFVTAIDQAALKDLSSPKWVVIGPEEIWNFPENGGTRFILNCAAPGDTDLPDEIEDLGKVGIPCKKSRPKHHLHSHEEHDYPYFLFSAIRWCGFY